MDFYYSHPLKEIEENVKYFSVEESYNYSKQMSKIIMKLNNNIKSEEKKFIKPLRLAFGNIPFDDYEFNETKILCHFYEYGRWNYERIYMNDNTYYYTTKHICEKAYDKFKYCNICKK